MICTTMTLSASFSVHTNAMNLEFAIQTISAFQSTINIAIALTYSIPYAILK